MAILTYHMDNFSGNIHFHIKCIGCTVQENTLELLKYVLYLDKGSK